MQEQNTDPFDARKERASTWFSELRDRIVAAFEALEDTQTEGPHAGLPAGRFEVTPTTRTGPDGEDQGGGKMSVMRGGRVFEKVGVNISTVWGTLAPRAQAGYRGWTLAPCSPTMSDSTFASARFSTC